MVLAHTTPPTSRDFGVWRQNLFIELERIVRKHGAQLNHLRQVLIGLALSNQCDYNLHVAHLTLACDKSQVIELQCIVQAQRP